MICDNNRGMSGHAPSPPLSPVTPRRLEKKTVGPGFMFTGEEEITFNDFVGVFLSLFLGGMEWKTQKEICFLQRLGHNFLDGVVGYGYRCRGM